ncbi:hypothetical protein [Cryobacterium aureum]|uniref:hypothetical protein n=1 Tax=Cryobacterium aureum TaxID=995037 RepID=UPI0013750A56|nr:hypothetical protein [Cryobacterium aureum]
MDSSYPRVGDTIWSASVSMATLAGFLAPAPVSLTIEQVDDAVAATLADLTE